MKRTTPGESGLSRVIRVLETFDVDRTTLTPAEISRRTGLPAPSTYRLVQEMVSQGLLERSKDGVSTGIRLWELATRGSKAVGLRSAARPFMEDLQRTFQQHTQLAVLNGTDIIYIEKMSAVTETVVNVTHIAKRLPASVSSGGLVLAAFAPDDVQREILASGIPQYTHLTPPDTRDFPRLLAEIRRQRYARADGWIDAGVTGIAAPIWDRQRNVVASLSLFLPNDRSSAVAAIPALQIAAASVSRALGWTPAPRSSIQT